MENLELESTAAAKLAIEAAAPEREGLLKELWENYSPTFLQASDRPGFVMEGGPFQMILFTQRTMLEMWLLGFAAQQAFVDYAGLFFAAGLFKMFPRRDIFDVNNEPYSRLIECVNKLTAVEKIEDFQWPKEVPHPKYRKPKALLGAMTFDLLVMAAAHVFLHEVEHVKIKSLSVKMTPREEELKCDTFARSILLDDIAAYSRASGDPLSILTTKRAMSIGLASFFLLTITPPKLWGGSDIHPPIMERVTVFTDSLSLPPMDHFWIYLSALVVAHLRFVGVQLPTIEWASHKDICLQLLHCLPNA
jgi:hypothetical protein